MIVTYRHFKTIPARKGTGWCNRAGRPWFKRHGLVWHDFVQYGIDEEILLGTGDGMALQLVEWARKCERREAARG